MLACFVKSERFSGIALPSTALLETERKSIFLNGQWAMQTEGTRKFGHADVTPDGATVVFHDVVYADRSKFAPVGLMVRTNGVMTLAASANPDAPPWSVTIVPDTKGQWRYIVPDSASAVTTGKPLGANIIYFKFSGASGSTVDVDYVNMSAPTQLTAPHFVNPFPDTEIILKGIQYATTYAATDANASDTLVYEAIKLPVGATLNTATGAVAWTPTSAQLGMQDVILSVTDGVSISTVAAKLNVQPDRAAAFQAATAGYDPQAVYTTLSLDTFKTELENLRQQSKTVTDADFPAVLKAVQVSVKKLQLLNPLVSSDGSLDWSKSMVTTTGFGADRPALLVDGDYNSYSGDLRAPIYIDFGENYRVSVSAFGIQARFMFANRSQGANVYGSNDNANWTLLSSRETSDTTGRNFEMENIPVIAGTEQNAYRYFMVRVDHPGIPTDPAYPGISSYGEFRFFGTRHDLLTPVDFTANVKIARSGLTLNRFTSKYTGAVTITNTSNATLSGNLQFRLDGLTSGVTLDEANGIRAGAPYITLSQTQLAPGASATLNTTFTNPAKAAISYTPRLINVKY